MQTTVLGFIMSHKDQRVALVRRNLSADKSFTVDGFRGQIREHETPPEAMNRAVREIVGADIPEDDWRYFAKITDTHSWLVFCFVAMVEPAELDELRSTSPSQIDIATVRSLSVARKGLALHLLFLLEAAINSEDCKAGLQHLLVTYSPGSPELA